MFGYVRPSMNDLSPEAQTRYRAHYCGLCRTLGKRHGAAGQMALNFDLTYLTIFLSALYEPREVSGESRCVPHPAHPHPWAVSEITDYAADMTVALTYHKCRDDWADDRNLLAKGYGALLKRQYGQVKKQWPRQCEAIETCLTELSAVEQRRDSNPDAAANAFGALMAELFVMQPDYWQGTLRVFGHSLGRFIYLMDAVCDMDRDAKKEKAYNPMLMLGHAPEELRPLLEMLLGDASAAFEKLPLIQDEEILRNILYSGVWQGYNEYLEKRKKEGNVHGE